MRHARQEHSQFSNAVARPPHSGPQCDWHTVGKYTDICTPYRIAQDNIGRVEPHALYEHDLKGHRGAQKGFAHIKIRSSRSTEARFKDFLAYINMLHTGGTLARPPTIKNLYTYQMANKGKGLYLWLLVLGRGDRCQ